MAKLARALYAACVIMLVARGGRADGRTAFLIERLKADDFRVRSSAALALGASNDDGAVQPLCGAIGDSSEVVRLAVGAGLKRLGRASALPCLKDRIAIETNDPAKTQMQQAFDAITASGAGGGGAPRSVPGAKYYVAFSRLTNNTGRPQAEVETLVFGAMRSKFDALGNYQLAPSGESADAARATISRRSLKGYYLSILLDKFDYSGGNLKVSIKLAVFTYPGKDLRGEVPAAASQPGIQPGDKGSEDALMSALATNAVERFAAAFQ